MEYSGDNRCQAVWISAVSSPETLCYLITLQDHVVHRGITLRAFLAKLQKQVKDLLNSTSGVDHGSQ